MNSGEKLSKEDFKQVRNILRWANVGAVPAAAPLDSVVAVLKNAKNELLDSVTGVIDELRRGVMVSQAACKTAEKVLTDVFNQMNSNNDLHFEVDR